MQIINKDSNRKILNALREAYPTGLSVEELSEVTKLPVKTVYAQKSELYQEYYINHIEEEKQTRRGRPSKIQEEINSRKRARLVIEELYGVHDMYEGNKPIPLPPGHTIYSEGLTETLNKLVLKEEKKELSIILLDYIKKVLSRAHNNDDIKNKWAPINEKNYCCTQCGLNHEARDFFRVILMFLIDEFEESKFFMDFLKDENLMTQHAYEKIQNLLK
ncbi:MAG: hypothetical protein H0X03_04370 [Nitrosopumilus sp.]|nr:hypothetical protein [Nitrosopumilus sp.]